MFPAGPSDDLRNFPPMRTLLIFLLLLAPVGAEGLFDPPRTRALVIGVLSFQHSDVYDSFGTKDRHDAELARLLRDKGVEVTYLEDQAATLKAIQQELPRLAAASGPQDQLIVYYAGHGGKNEAGDDVLLANYDAGESEEGTLSVQWILSTLRQGFHGKRVVLLLDCCSSGGLADQLQARPGKLQGLALTSSSANEISTGTWTFTQDLLEGLRGNPTLDGNHDGVIQLSELGHFVRQDMAAYHGQLASYVRVGGFPDLDLGPVSRAAAPGEGQRVEARDEGKWWPARVVKREPGRVRVRWLALGYDTAASDQWKTLAEVRPLPTAPVYPKGTRVQVEWKGEWWPAEVMRAQDGLHHIHYTGYGAEWDEWVPPQRIKPGQARGRSRGGAARS